MSKKLNKESFCISVVNLNSIKRVNNESDSSKTKEEKK